MFAAKYLPDRAVVIVDEAGQISGRQLFDLIRLVKERRGQLILSGDTRQHGPVEASDALRAIERYSGLRAADASVSALPHASSRAGERLHRLRGRNCPRSQPTRSLIRWPRLRRRLHFPVRLFECLSGN
jgi:hypothetical protein